MGTSMPICQEISVQTENEEIWRKEYIGKGSGKKEQRVENEENENIIILDEMNPNLSFSSCPLSDIKTHPSKESLNELKTHKENFREGNYLVK